MRFITVDATSDHMAEMSVTARQQDKDEVFYQTGRPLRECLDYAYAVSPLSKASYWDGKLAVVWGTETFDKTKAVGIPWLTATPAIYKAKKEFKELSVEMGKQLREGYLYLANHVYTKNTAAIKWIKWMNFVVYPPVRHGPQKKMFHPFDWRSPICVQPQAA